MLKNLFPKTSPKNKPISKLHAVSVHPIISFAVISCLSLVVIILAVTLNVEENAISNSLMLTLRPLVAHAQEQWQLADFTSVDVMKLTKDVVRNQLTDSDINSVVDALSQTHAKYIAISVPLDASSDYPAPKPAPRTAEAFTQAWADAIHQHNMKVLWRGTWSGIEGIYDFPRRAGQSRFPPGSASSAISDGDTTWLGKTYLYIVNHPSYFRDGDIWAPLPERTEGIFQDNTSFLPYDGPGIQANYANFFNDLKLVSNQAFGSLGIKVYTGWTSNNLSEINSGWLSPAVFESAGVTATDYYGDNHSPEEMENSLILAYQKTHRQIYLQEWSDYWNGKLAPRQREDYLDSMYQTFQHLGDAGVLMGFNYWGGWPGAVESILEKTPGGYSLNSRGRLLRRFFDHETTPTRRGRPIPKPLP